MSKSGGKSRETDDQSNFRSVLDTSFLADRHQDIMTKPIPTRFGRGHQFGLGVISTGQRYVNLYGRMIDQVHRESHPYRLPLAIEFVVKQMESSVSQATDQLITPIYLEGHYWLRLNQYNT